MRVYSPSTGKPRVINGHDHDESYMIDYEAVHGHVIRTLDAEGIRAVKLWDAREISSHLLLMLSFVSLGLVALTRNAPATTGRPEPNVDVGRLV